MERAEKIAYGPLNLLPHEFEELQPHEFEKLLDGYRSRKRESELQQAYFTAWIVNVQLTKPISAQQILDPLWKAEENEKQTEDDEDYMRKAFRMPKGGK